MKKVTLQGDAMGGPWSVTFIAPHKCDVVSIKNIIQKDLDLVDTLMSPYNENSEVSVLNKADLHNWKSVSQHVFNVIKEGLEIGKETNGALDITLGALVEKWGFGHITPPLKLLSEEQKNTAMQLSGLDLVKIKHNNVCKLGPVQFDLCALAKGYAADVVGQSLRGMNINDFLINVAGDLLANGKTLEGELWCVGVELPLPDMQVIFQKLKLSNLALASSGTYRNSYEIEGVKLNHLLDPKKREPIEFGLMNVTVCGNSCMRADALATALAVMGPEFGPKFANDENINAIFCVAVKDGFKEIGTGQIEQYLS